MTDAPTTRSEPLDPATRRALGLTIAALFGIGLVAGGGGAIWTDVLDRFGVGDSVLGLGLGIEGLAVLPALVLGGKLTARLGATRMVALGAGLLAAAAVWAISAAGLVAFLVMFVVRGGGLSLIDLGGNTIAMEIERDTRRHVMGFVHAGFSGGVAVGAGVALAVYAADVRHEVVYVVLGTLLGGLLLTALVQARRLGRPGRQRRPAMAGTLSLRAFESRIVRLSAVANGLAFGVEVLTSQWVAAYLRDDRGASPEASAVSVVLFAVTMLAGRLTNGMLTRRASAESLLVAQGALVAVGGVLIVASPALWVMLAGCVVAGFGVAGIVPTVLSLAAAGGGASPGDTAGASLLGGYLGGLLLPLMAGGLTAVASLRAGVALVPLGGLVLVATGILVVREMRVQPTAALVAT